MIAKVPQIHTARCLITLLQHYDYRRLLDYHQQNEAHLSPWEPIRNRDYFTEPVMRQRIQISNDAFVQGRAVHFVAYTKGSDEIIGVCNFTNIVAGLFQACHVGNSIDEKHQGQGVMKEILTSGIEYMFEAFSLHRIMANYIPVNDRSGALLSSIGFETEGLAKSYLKIAGKWQDHVLTSKLNPADI